MSATSRTTDAGRLTVSDPQRPELEITLQLKAGYAMRDRAVAEIAFGLPAAPGGIAPIITA
jgi:hypothetical protein